MKYQPGISRVQLRELRKAIKRCKNSTDKIKKRNEAVPTGDNEDKKTEKKAQDNEKKEPSKNQTQGIDQKQTNETESKTSEISNKTSTILDDLESALNEDYTIKDIISELECDPDLN